MGTAAAGTVVEVTVGQTLVVDVGNAIGWYCDNPQLVIVQMVSREDHNEWIVTGAVEGSTLCRVGMNPGLPNFLLEVHVVPLG